MSYTDEDYWFEMKYRDLSEEQQAILNLIGYEAYEKLISSFGGRYIKLPCVNVLTRKLRNKKILEDYGKGIPSKALADKYGISIDRVRSIIKNGK